MLDAYKAGGDEVRTEWKDGNLRIPNGAYGDVGCPPGSGSLRIWTIVLNSYDNRLAFGTTSKTCQPVTLAY